jgi:hypothetical protein
MLNLNSEKQYFKDPFPIAIFKDFFDKDFFLELEKKFPHQSLFLENNVNRMHGDTTYGDSLYKKLLYESPAYKKLHEWVYSENFVKFFLDLFKNELKFQNDLIEDISEFKIKSTPTEVGNIFNLESFEIDDNKYLYPRLDIGFGKKGYGIKTGGRGPHIDNPQRLISVLIYLGGYNSMTGGEHRVYSLISQKLNLEKVFPTEKNLLIASLQNNVAFHDVNPIIEIDGQRNAFYLAISASRRIWSKSPRTKINAKYNKLRVEPSLYEKSISSVKNIIKACIKD